MKITKPKKFSSCAYICGKILEKHLLHTLEYFVVFTCLNYVFLSLKNGQEDLQLLLMHLNDFDRNP